MAYVHVIDNLTSKTPRRASTVERRRLTLATIARRRGLDPRSRPVICSRNGAWVNQRDWRRTKVRPLDVVVFVLVPRSGTARSIAMLAILAAAAFAAPALLGVAGVVGAAGTAVFATGSVGATIAAGMTTAALAIGGNYLLNVLVPVRPAGNLGPSDAGSPTYENRVSAQQNAARLNGPIPVLYGRVRFIPDLASPPWWEFESRVQKYRQVLVLTQGEIDIEKIELGDAPLSSFTNVSAEIVQPGDQVTMFETDVYTSPEVAAIRLLASNDADAGSGGTGPGGTVILWDATYTYAINNVVLYYSFPLFIPTYYQSLQNGNLNHVPYASPTFWGPLTLAGGVTTTFGPFAACPPTKGCTNVGFDFSFPKGMFKIDKTTGDVQTQGVTWKIEGQKIDDLGNGLDAWFTLSTEHFDGIGGSTFTPPSPNAYSRIFLGGAMNNTNQMQSPLTISLRFNMGVEARWQFRCTRTSLVNVTDPCGDEVDWTGLRGFINSTGVYGDVTVLALETSATASVSASASRSVAITGTRKIPTYGSPPGWTAPIASRSIAWAVVDMLKNTTYGNRLSDSDYDLAQLVALDAVWTARGDKFDYYDAQESTVWAVVNLALRAGRALAYHQAGIVRFHRDQAQTVPVQMFSRENIVKGSFSMNFVLPSPEDETDSLEIRYLSEDNWTWQYITLPKEGVVDPQAPSSNALDGVVQTTQANNEAAYLLAADRYRRVLASFDTELEGFIPSRGDLVLVQHDMPRWAHSSRVFAYDAATLTVTLWGRLDIDSTVGTWLAYFRDAQGRPSTETAVDWINDSTLEMKLTAAPVYADLSPFDLTQVLEAEPIHVVVGTADTQPRLAIFLGATPRGGRRITIDTVLENDLVHVN